MQVGEVETVDGTVQRAQGAQFVHPADRPAAGDGKAHARAAFAALGGGLEYEHAQFRDEAGRIVARGFRAMRSKWSR
jgi:hypothetical protein